MKLNRLWFDCAFADAISENNPRVIDDARARKLAADLRRCVYYETCATYGLNIERVFQDGQSSLSLPSPRLFLSIVFSLSLSFSHKEQQLKKKKRKKKSLIVCDVRGSYVQVQKTFFFSLKSVTVLCSIDLFGVDLTIFCVSVAIVVVSDVILLTGHYRIEFISMLHCYWIKLIWLNWGCWSRSTWNAVGCWTWNRNPADSTDRNGQNQILPTLKQIQQKFFINFLNF